MSDEMTTLLNTLAQRVFDKKGFNILALDIRGISSLTDYLFIAEGNVERHVKALGKEVVKVVGEAGMKPLHVEGGEIGDWVVIDLGAVIIHLFSPGLREKYALEELWKEGKTINFN